jgi:hypothetical protein
VPFTAAHLSPHFWPNHEHFYRFYICHNGCKSGRFFCIPFELSDA